MSKIANCRFSIALLCLGTLIFAVDPHGFRLASASDWPSLDYDPPGDWQGPVFKLSQDYPTTPPSPETSQEARWLDIEPDQKPIDYLVAVLDYCFEDLENVDFVPQDSTGRKWYHVPYMHIGRHPREFVHGMTEERAAQPGELAPNQTKKRRNFAVGLYNAPGGYAIGRMWGNSTGPVKNALAFPEQSVTFKLLFTSASDTEVPWLVGAPHWTTDIRVAGDDLAVGRVDLRLLQVDIAVKDHRGKSGGWVFGTFEYDPDAKALNSWRKLRPVTLMWGNDHLVMQSDVDAGTPIAESWVNPDSRVLKYRKDPATPVSVPKVLGYAGRGNGPVDNFLSSCMSCHSVAQYPNQVAMAPRANMSEAEREPWFRNLSPGEAFTNGAKSMDFSLQLAVSLQNWDAEHPLGPGSPPVASNKAASAPFFLKADEIPNPEWKGAIPQQVPITRGEN